MRSSGTPWWRHCASTAACSRWAAGRYWTRRPSACSAASTVIYLETGLHALAARNGLDRPRPLLMGNPRAQLKALLTERLPVYEGLATVTVPTDDYAPEEIADELAGKIGAAVVRSAENGLTQ